jgi:hypothetical protein
MCHQHVAAPVGDSCIDFDTSAAEIAAAAHGRRESFQQPHSLILLVLEGTKITGINAAIAARTIYFAAGRLLRRRRGL